METRAPSVVAVVVTTEPGDHLDATLSSLSAQDYGELSILVMAVRPDPALRASVAKVAPGAFVAAVEEGSSFGAAINQSLAMVEGASFLLLCHDDVHLDADAVHLLVEEAFRSNAGIVTPKVVSMDDRRVLLHVGQGVDRYGTVIEKIQPGEVDQGQHDAVRDVFVAPGGVTLIRDDLLRLLGGFDARYLAMGDDVELSWRARLAGARIVCAPQATVAHAERLAAGLTMLEPLDDGEPPPTLSRLWRRNELRTLMICWGTLQRALTLAMFVALNVVEIVISVVGQDHDRAVDIREAWRTAWRERKANRAARKQVHAIRTVSDRTIRSFQTKGATRVRVFVTTLAHHGYDAARGVWSPSEEVAEEAPELTASFGGAFSEDEGFDELDDLGRRAGRKRGRRRLSSPRAIVLLSAALVLVYSIGSRNLVGSNLPMLGQLVPLGSWSSVWHQVFASWQPAGLGSGAPGHPGFISLGLLGTLTLGQMGAAVRVILLLAVPIGAIGTSRLVAPLTSGRARLLAAAAFIGLGLGANSIAGGDVGAVAALGAMPFILRRILRLAEVPPFDEPFGATVALGSRGWRASRVGQVVALGLLVTIFGALAPALLVVVLVVAVAVAIGSLLVGAPQPAQGLLRVLGALVVSLILLAPLTLSAALAGGSGLTIFGTAPAPWSTPGVWGLLRFAVGPNSAGPLTWLLPVAALVPLLIARHARLLLAAILTAVGVLSLALATVVAHGGIGTFAPDLLVVLAPLAVAVAALVGLGLGAFEIDLPSADFGWRQLIGLLGVGVALLGLVPFVVDAGNGRWHMPTNDYSDSLSFLRSTSSVGTRVLWLGDPRGIPGGSWSIQEGLGWSTSLDGLPTGANLYAPAQATAGTTVSGPVELAIEGKTVHLGQLLAPAGVTQVVVVTSVAPNLTGAAASEKLPPPAALLPALRHQLDLQEVPGGGGAVIFNVTGSMPVVSTRRAPLRETATPSNPAATSGWRGLDGTSSTSGTAPRTARHAYVGFAPASAFTLRGSKAAPTSAFGWAQTFPLSSSTVSVVLSAPPLDGVLAAVTLIGWLAVSLCLIGRHRWLDWWWRRPRVEPVDPEELEEQMP